MQVEYTDHGLERLRDRGISRKSVREALVHGQKRESQTDGSTKVSHLNSRELIIIYRLLAKNKYLIITGYYAN